VEIFRHVHFFKVSLYGKSGSVFAIADRTALGLSGTYASREAEFAMSIKRGIRDVLVADRAFRKCEVAWRTSADEAAGKGRGRHVGPRFTSVHCK